MAGLGRRIFTAGEVLTAANVNGYLMDQSVMVFADSSARDTGIPTPSEGMVAYISDTNALQKYDGASWLDVDGYVRAGTAGNLVVSAGTAGLDYVANGTISQLLVSTGTGVEFIDNTATSDYTSPFLLMGA
jgi:hypothetical protein